MTKVSCPLPQVEDALTPYINTREKTTRIRQILTEHVRRQIQSDGSPTHLALSIPPASLVVRGPSYSGSGLYQEYLQALEANQQARSRYNAIKEDIEQSMCSGSTSRISYHEDGAQDPVRTYATLLRQRRRLRKLEIVQDALTKLLDEEPNPASVDIKFEVREETGDPPEAPIVSFVANPEDGGGDNDVRELTVQLKKELLLAKNKLLEARAAKEEAAKTFSNGSGKSQDVIAILQEARDELISWVEGELAKIPEDEVEASQAEISFLGGDDEDGDKAAYDLSNEELMTRIEQNYRKYLDSRRRYIAEVDATLAMTAKLQEHRTTSSGAPMHAARRASLSSAQEIQNSSIISASDLLPALTQVNATAQTAAQLQSDTAHLRRQLELASTEAQAQIQRLAGESLLVAQDSTSVASWSNAAKESNDKTKDMVMSHVIEGEASVAMAKRVLDELRGRRQGLESLRRDL